MSKTPSPFIVRIFPSYQETPKQTRPACKSVLSPPIDSPIRSSTPKPTLAQLSEKAATRCRSWIALADAVTEHLAQTSDFKKSLSASLSPTRTCSSTEPTADNPALPANTPTNPESGISEEAQMNEHTDSKLEDSLLNVTAEKEGGYLTTDDCGKEIKLLPSPVTQKWLRTESEPSGKIGPLPMQPLETPRPAPLTETSGVIGPLPMQPLTTPRSEHVKDQTPLVTAPAAPTALPGRKCETITRATGFSKSERHTPLMNPAGIQTKRGPGSPTGESPEDKLKPSVSATPATPRASLARRCKVATGVAGTSQAGQIVNTITPSKNKRKERSPPGSAGTSPSNIQTPKLRKQSSSPQANKPFTEEEQIEATYGDPTTEAEINRPASPASSPKLSDPEIAQPRATPSGTKATAPLPHEVPKTPKNQGARRVIQSPHGPKGITVVEATPRPPTVNPHVHSNPAYLVPRHIDPEHLLWNLQQNHPDLAAPATRLKRTKKGLNLIITANQAAKETLRWPVLYGGSYVTIPPFTPNESAQHKVFVLGPISGNIHPNSIRDPKIVTAKIMGRKAHIDAGHVPYKLLVTYRDASRPTSIVGPGGPIKTEELRATPIRCTNCQALDHHRKACKAGSICTWCAGAHKSDVCFQKRKLGQFIKVKCANCMSAGHTASSSTCPKWIAALGRKPNTQVLIPSNSQTSVPIRPLMADFRQIQQDQEAASSSGASIHTAQSAEQTSVATPEYWNPPRPSGPPPPLREDFLTYAYFACQRILSDYRRHNNCGTTKLHLAQLNGDIAFHSHNG